MLLPELQSWKSEGQFLTTTLFDHAVFYKTYGAANATPEKTLLLLHGFPESSFSYHKIIDGIREYFDRVVLFDMIGYGLSAKPMVKYGYSLAEQADVALQVWKHLGITGGHLLAHDMGNSVATELIARHVSGLLPAWFSADFQSFTLTNGSIVLELADLRITQKILLSKYGRRFSGLVNYKLFSQQVRSAHGNDKLSDKDIELLWNNSLQNEGHKKTYLTIQYLNGRKRFEKTRWLPSLAKVKLPVHLCWGDADSVARVEMVEYLKKNVCPNATVTIMKDVGHFCQLGSPDIWVKSVMAFYRGI